MKNLKKRLIPKIIMPKNNDFTIGDSILMPFPKNIVVQPIIISESKNRS